MGIKVNKNIWLPLFILVVGAWLGYQIMADDTSKAKRYKKHQQQQAKNARVVETMTLTKGSIIPFWDSSGFVTPAELVQVSSKVSGYVQQVNAIAIPGGVLKEGEWLLKLDPTDFELALASEKAKLSQEQSSLYLEQANQTLAKEELSFMTANDDVELNNALILREPQINQAKSKVSIAQNNVNRAALNLSRTEVRMPFDGMIMGKNIGRGSKVNANSQLFTVVNTAKFWLEVKIPHHFLSVIDSQAPAKLSQDRLWGVGNEREAKFISILPELDSKDRQVKVLLEINDPLSEGRVDSLHQSNDPLVLLNDFLSVRLYGKPIEDAWVIRHHWLQPDNTIWVVDSENTLQKREVIVLFKGQEFIYVASDLQQGDLALAEKPGIVSVGLPVKTKQPLKMKQKKRKDVTDEV